ncbi:MAG: XdhC family protein [Desulfurococcaceae archaeon]
MRPEWLEIASRELRSGKRIAIVTIISKEGSGPRDVGASMIVTEDGRKYGTIGGGSFEKLVIGEAVKAIREGSPRLVKIALRRESVPEGAIVSGQMCGGVVDVFVNVIRPPTRAILIGAGHVGKPIADVLNLLGLRLVVIDRDPSLASRERYPYAEAVLVGEPHEEVRKLELGADDIVIIAFGDVEVDYAVLKELVSRGFGGHIWALCSRYRCRWELERLIKEGIDPSPFAGRLHMPAGLDIGADSPEEIAISIAAEVVCVLRGCKTPVQSLDVSREVVAKG